MAMFGPETGVMYDGISPPRVTAPSDDSNPPRDNPHALDVMTPVARIGRILDLAGLVVFLVGGGLVIRAWSGFREVQEFEPSFGDPPMAAVQLADSFWWLEKVGMALMLTGIGVFVAAWWIARRRGHVR